MDYVIIVAGGKGLRMGSDIPKQFLPVAGKPILMRTIERFHEYNPELSIILVLPESQQEYWHQLCEEYHFNIKPQKAVRAERAEILPQFLSGHIPRAEKAPGKGQPQPQSTDFPLHTTFLQVTTAKIDDTEYSIFCVQFQDAAA